MRLDERLRLLRGEVPQPTPAALQGDLAERLRRLTPMTRQPAPSGAPDEKALVDVLGAERLAPGVLRVERRFGRDWLRGPAWPGDYRQSLPNLVGEGVGSPGNWLFLDTETSGLAGGTGTWAFLCGLLRIEEQGLLLRQYLLTRLDAEFAYLEAIGAELRGAELLVTYNGKSFDGPLLSTRFRLAGLPDGIGDKGHLDLLHPVRCAFARVWPDCRLATVEQRLLDVARQGDLPGAEAPGAWLAWLRHGEIRALSEVLSHNRRDLLSLPTLAAAMTRCLCNPASLGADVRGVARYWLARGQEATALSLLAQDRHALDADGLFDLARLYRRRREWAQAHPIWRSLAARGHARGIEALAKYLEHRERDYVQALEWVDRLPAGSDREYRRRRIERKRQGRAPGLLLTKADGVGCE